ncbi:MAG: DNA integrity scanning protein DisA nucleotide-binding domain protein [Planctomycetes bacterium]|nr:DNA integrity scanning protein DisA nucleotide-binding domain protein [Planctomycetota bacterium]MBL7038222.1 DNA integrity scanning protein DisA nucleotide-binding domain protein [Pirellulaceae bacterium]
MINTILSFLSEFRRTIRIADGVDILLMSVFLYSALVWFKQTASRRVLVGMFFLFVVYLLAQAFDMYLTSLVFHTGFAVLLIVLVVIFQEDLRRMFERFASLGSLRRLRRVKATAMDVDALVEAVFTLAADKTGALVVLKGNEPLDRHLNGGVFLGGEISKPLLYSLFDASSPGHDGAAVVDGNRIDKFSAHLPISKNQKEVAGRGTRHSAALGLSECSDALVIVASEERGVVSVAEGGKLEEAASAAALMARVEKYMEAKFPQQTTATWKRLLMKHGLLKMLALTLAIVAWFAMAYNPHTIQRTFVTHIEYRYPPTRLLLDERAPDEARITLSGSERSFRFLDPGSLKISIDLTEARIGRQEIAITEKNVRLPTNLTLYRIEPRVIRLHLHEPPAPGANSEIAPKKGEAKTNGR